MKTQTKRKMTLKKLVIARINPIAIRNIKGGDCYATEPGWEDHNGTDGVDSALRCPSGQSPF